MRKIVLLLSLLSFAYAEENLEDLKRQLQELQKKIDQLEKGGRPQETAKPFEPADRSLQLKLKYSDSLRVYAPFSQRAFLPNISLIVQGSYINRNVSDKTYQDLLFGHSHADHSHGISERGFNLDYAELYFYAPVDPYFDLYAVIPFTEDGAEVEEAYFVTRGLPYGFQLKAGKFRSSFGRLNVFHPHMWDFTDLPLPYLRFLGEEGYSDKGVQVTWLAPTPFYLLIGGEALQGEQGPTFNRKFVYTGFVKTSFDVGNLSVLAGTSAMTDRYDTRLYGADLTARYGIDSYRYVALQAEYLYRDKQEKDKGAYAQLVWRFHNRWRTGIRYEFVDQHKTSYGYAWMLEFNPTEFSRFRLQLGQRKLFGEETSKRVNEVSLIFQMAIGAHGAHPF
ncbi:conserved hypothetical protein [Thermocrinis albus DSM 14484]|uniref:Zinc-regulated TonB-dependent outer membrane receptor n=1 Tax=Thermocrinis albus (strain DSM 14484 / JCM 11386 / HI 11/12) TaxID=638303 RepID=D3SLU1_THEAH|nr:hypothetical protein [Thermocrinis albus]ADC89721.1 conserved hypothetical protein [Thermocrinis albus DSM 14484]